MKVRGPVQVEVFFQQFASNFSGLCQCGSDWLTVLFSAYIIVHLHFYVSLGFFIVFVTACSGFYLIGWEEHVRKDLFCVEWDVIPYSILSATL